MGVIKVPLSLQRGLSLMNQQRNTLVYVKMSKLLTGRELLILVERMRDGT